MEVEAVVMVTIVQAVGVAQLVRQDIPGPSST